MFQSWLNYGVYKQWSVIAWQSTHDQCKRSDYNQVILVHVDVVHRPTPETCDNSVFKIGW